MVEQSEDSLCALADTGSEKENSSELLLQMHPLERTWTLWFLNNNRQRSWEDNQAKVASFATVEDFWSLFNHIERAGQLPLGCDYSVFKDDIVPAWEDERNRPGGRWVIQLERNSLNSDTDEYWMEILMMLIGEGFKEERDHICGAVVSLRARMDKLAVWIDRDLDANSSEILRIGQIIKERLRLGPRMMSYQTHSDMAAKTKGGAAKITYYL